MSSQLVSNMEAKAATAKAKEAAASSEPAVSEAPKAAWGSATTEDIPLNPVRCVSPIESIGAVPDLHAGSSLTV
jgi:hypothetical protein